MAYTLPPLPYAFDALEPYIDARTMEIHHDRHHQGYINNLNKALEQYPELQEHSLKNLLQSLDTVPEKIRTAVRNNGGGTYNHNFFWTILSPTGGGNPQGTLAKEIIKRYSSFDAMKHEFNNAAKSVFGSGWAWLCIMPSGSLEIITTANQDSPISQGAVPVVGLDVWEHAYYLKYQNRRPDYIQAWWYVVNWEQAENNYKQV